MLRYPPGIAPIVVDVRLGFATSVPPDAVTAVDLQPGDGQRALASLRVAGVLLHSTRMR